MAKAVFLDRDGVINRERGDYTFLPEQFELLDGVGNTIDALSNAGFRIIVITNQAGIAKGLYTEAQMNACHEKMHEACHGQIDAVYFAPLHPTVSESLARKPDSLMFERAIARFKIDFMGSWMVGDKDRDLIPAKKLGIKTIGIGELFQGTSADYKRSSLSDSLDLILS